MGSKPPREAVYDRANLLPGQQALAERQQEDVREDVRALVASLDVTGPGVAVTEPLLSRNVVSLCAGDHGGWRQTKPGTLVCGIVPGARLTRRVTISEDCILRNLQIGPFDDDGGVLVDVTSATATVRFVGVDFFKDGDVAHVQCVVGTQLIFNDCTLAGGNAGASGPISNPGAAGNVQFVASYNNTGNAFVNVTTVASF